jgi:hypothetical protein
MANRHKATGRFAKGGKVLPDPEHQRKVEREAGLKTGGAVKAPKLKTGGKVPALATGGRLDKRARGGGVGADKNPFSSAKLK